MLNQNKIDDDNNKTQSAIINHIHPLRERIIITEQTLAHQQSEIANIRSGLQDVKHSIKETNDLCRTSLELSKKIYNTFVGSGIAAISIWAIIKIILPMIH